MQIFQNYDSNCFLLNGNKYVKNFIVMPAGNDAICLYNAFDTRLQLMPATKYSDVLIDGASFPSQKVLMDALTPMVFAKQVVSENSFKDEIISIGEITRNENQLTIPALAVWRIGGILHSNDNDSIAVVEYAASGNTRIDIIVAKSDSTFELITGLESADIANAPTLPVNTLLVTTITVNGEDFIYENPFTGLEFVRKDEASEIFAGTYSPEPKMLINGKWGAIRFIGGCEMLGTFDIFNPELLYAGKRLLIKNFQSVPLTLKHDFDGGTYPMFFPNEEDLILLPNAIAEFALSKRSNKFEFIGASIANSDATQNLQSILDNGNTATGQTITVSDSYSDIGTDTNQSNTIGSRSILIYTENPAIDQGGEVSVLTSSSDGTAVAAIGVNVQGGGELGAGYVVVVDVAQKFVNITPTLMTFGQATTGGTSQETSASIKAIQMIDSEHPEFTLPPKNTGIYTLATTEDLSGTLQEVLAAGDTAITQNINLVSFDESGGFGDGKGVINLTSMDSPSTSAAIGSQSATFFYNPNDGVTPQGLGQMTFNGYYIITGDLSGGVSGGTGMFYSSDNIHFSEKVAGGVNQHSTKLKFNTPTGEGFLIFPNVGDGTKTIATLDDIVPSANYYTTGGTFSAQTLTLKRNDGGNVIITGFTDNNTFTTGGTYSVSGKTLSLNSNVGTTYSISGVSEVTQTINSGSTSTAPSEAAVSHALLNREFYHYKDFSDGAIISGQTSEVLAESVFVSGGTFQTNSQFIVNYNVNKPASDGGGNINLYINSANTLTNAIQLGMYTWSATARELDYEHKVYVKNNSLFTYPLASVTALSNIGVVQNSTNSTVFNPAVDCYILLSITSASANNVIQRKALTIKTLK